ncbi:hypothetical protein RJ639_011646 [Escallonia herrerae]|uniref:Cytochrome P450 n=1 Tax=Escallonia herrerae TaxID=1293975 RepID=A0AA88VM79_9ASTE|nr:hypothetical protein RJ639_011646 [Escallonia herrerae]
MRQRERPQVHEQSKQQQVKQPAGSIGVAASPEPLQSRSQAGPKNVSPKTRSCLPTALACSRANTLATTTPTLHGHPTAATGATFAHLSRSNALVRKEMVEMKSVFFELMMIVMMSMIAGKRYYGEKVKEAGGPGWFGGGRREEDYDGSAGGDAREGTSVIQMKLSKASCYFHHRAVSIASVFTIVQCDNAHCTMGKDVAHTEEAKRFQDIVLEVSRVGAASTVGDFLPIMRWFGNTGAEKLMQIHEKRDGFMQDLIHGHRESKFDASSQGREKTMIEVLLSLHETETENYTDETIRGLTVVLFQAGADTSVGTREWAMSHLLNNPKILKRAQTEIDNHVGHIRLIAESDVGELPYLNCIIKETLRLNPPAPLLVPHESLEEFTVGGFRIPSGTMLMVNVWGIQNDPKFWVDPEKFMHERFEGTEGTKNGEEVWPGENLAIRMVGLAVGSVLQCFDWEWIGKELVDMTEGTAATMSKAAPLMAKCRPRAAAVSLLSPFRTNSNMRM